MDESDIVMLSLPKHGPRSWLTLRQAQGDGGGGRVGDIVAIVVFLVMIAVPGVFASAGYARADVPFIEQSEQRRPFVAPAVSAGALATGGYERDVERQIADAFPLRTWLVEAYDYPKFVWFGESTSTSVVRGRDGWLFYGAEESAYVTGAWNPSQAELAHLASVYAERARWCRAHGIAYVFLIVPNKSSISPGEAPPWYRAAGPTPLDRLLPMLRDAHVAALDVRAPMRDSAQRGEVYSKGDTHWNDAGAYVAYHAVVAALGSAGVRDAVKPTGTHIVEQRGDLLNFSGVGARIMDRVVVFDYPHRARQVAAPELEAEAAANQFSLRASAVDAPLPVAVIFGDSFSGRLAPFLAEDFRRTFVLEEGTALTRQFDPAAVLAVHANVVVQELVERNFTFAAAFRPDVP